MLDFAKRSPLFPKGEDFCQPEIGGTPQRDIIAPFSVGRRKEDPALPGETGTQAQRSHLLASLSVSPAEPERNPAPPRLSAGLCNHSRVARNAKIRGCVFCVTCVTLAASFISAKPLACRRSATQLPASFRLCLAVSPVGSVSRYMCATGTQRPSLSNQMSSNL